MIVKTGIIPFIQSLAPPKGEQDFDDIQIKIDLFYVGIRPEIQGTVVDDIACSVDLRKSLMGYSDYGISFSVFVNSLKGVYNINRL